MQILLDIIVPVFGIVAIGYLAARFGLFPRAANDGLTRFVFTFAIPPMLFRSMATNELPDPIEWGFLISYFGGGYLVWAVGMLVSSTVFRRPFEAASVAGMTGAFGNTVLLGIPLILATYGDAGTLPVFLIISFHSWQLLSVVTVLIEGGRGNRYRLMEVPWNILKGLVGNPIIIGLVLGIVWNVADLPLPKTVDVLAETLGRAALPCAVFAMGASLASYRVMGALAEAGVGVVLKLIAHPAAVWVLATYVLEVEQPWRDIAVIVAALPVGVNVYLVAERYETGSAPAATAILLSTALSVITVAILLTVLDVRPG